MLLGFTIGTERRMSVLLAQNLPINTHHQSMHFAFSGQSLASPFADYAKSATTNYCNMNRGRHAHHTGQMHGVHVFHIMD